MESLTVPRSREDTLTVVKLALEKTDPISTYHFDGETITAKTGHHPLKFQTGSVVTIEIPKDQPSDSGTVISLSTEIEYKIEVHGALTTSLESNIVEIIEKFDGIQIHKIEQLQREATDNGGKEVEHPRDQAGGKLKGGLMWGLYALVGFVLMLVVLFVFSS